MVRRACGVDGVTSESKLIIAMGGMGVGGFVVLMVRACARACARERKGRRNATRNRIMRQKHPVDQGLVLVAE